MGALDPDDGLYDAFRRDDQYGDLGRKRQTWQEYVRLALSTILVVPLKLVGILYFVVAFYLVCRYFLPHAIMQPTGHTIYEQQRLILSFVEDCTIRSVTA